MTTFRVRPATAVAVTFVAHALLFASWTAHIPQTKARLGIGDDMLGTALLGAPIGAVPAMAVTSRLIARLGSAWMIRITVAGYAVGGVGVGLAGSTVTLFLALAVWGAFQGALDVAMNTVAVAVERVRGRPIISRLHGMWSAGGFAGALLGAGAVGAGVGLSEQAAVLGLVAAVAVEVVSVGLGPADADNADRVRKRPAGNAIRPVAGVLLVLAGAAFASMLCEGAVADWSADYLHAELHVGAAEAGFGYAAYSLAMVATRLTGPALQVRFAARALLPALAVVFAVGMGVALATAQPIVALVGFACAGVGLGLVVPSMFSAAGHLADDGTRHASTGIAIVSALGWLGFVSGPPLIGHLSHWVGLTPALCVLPALALVIAAITRRHGGDARGLPAHSP